MTTHRGLGANTAFQDAVDLAKALKSPDWRKATAEYERVVVKRGIVIIMIICSCCYCWNGIITVICAGIGIVIYGYW